ncbi:DUF6809 family protein [Clostridium sp. D33t1_170424_F3]|uniref:DUF6809 family protein n=1 Tax=Clostridium sp. D33t1_170424_F3 TaxID=2787099 RepID=UPI0018AA2F6C|nr:DUF6809 family protein [Clostridium sp. D33t1_170424_F3]
MDSMIKALFRGEILPEERIVPDDPAYWPVNYAISDEKKYFEEKLTQEDKARFEKLDDLYYQSITMYGAQSFQYGFKLGALLMTDVFTGKEEVMPEKNN